MKIRVLIEFNDLQSKIIRKPGETFDVSSERAEELTSARNGTLVEIIDETDDDVDKDETDDDVDKDETDLTVKQIKEMLDQKGIEYNPKAKKKELIELLGGD